MVLTPLRGSLAQRNFLFIFFVTRNGAAQRRSAVIEGPLWGSMVFTAAARLFSAEKFSLHLFCHSQWSRAAAVGSNRGSPLGKMFSEDPLRILTMVVREQDLHPAAVG